MATYSNCRKHAEDLEEKVYLNIMAVSCVKKIDLFFVYIYAAIPCTQTVTCPIKLECADKGKIIHCTKLKELLYLYLFIY